MPAFAAPSLPAGLPATEELVQALLNISLTGLMVLQPVYDASGTDIIDLAWMHLNPAAQQMLGLPAQPSESFLTRFPMAQASGAFGFYRDAFLSGQVARRQNSYQHDHLDGYYQLVTQRQGEVLLVSFTDGNTQPRTAVEEELRASQARELTARAAAEALLRAAKQAHEQLHRLFMAAPAAICILARPELVYELVNPPYQALFPGRKLLGRPLLEALPELREHAVWRTLQHVYQTGETHIDQRVRIAMARADGAPLEDYYFNYTFQPRYGPDGRPDGVLVFAFDVTAHVRAQQQAEQLNNELEARVAERTREAQVARAEAERQRLQLERLFMAAPAAICILAGPELVYELVNPPYQALFPGRLLQGHRFADVFPELASHGVVDTFRHVYETGIANEEQAILIPFRRPGDGELEDRYFNYIQQARYDEHGRIDGVLVFAFEVTQQVRARQAVEASSQQLRLLTDALPVLIAYLDSEQRYRFVNQAYQTWFHREPAVLLGKTVPEVVGPQAYSGVRSYIERALAGERLEFEALMPYREGFVRRIHTDYIPDVRNGEIHGFYSLVTDITEQSEAREQVQALNEELAAINAELQAANKELRDTNNHLHHTNVDLDTFVYTASHDLKAPIANIEGLVLALSEQLPLPVRQDPDVMHLLSLIQGSVVRFQRTLDQLTDVSKLQQAHTTPAEAVDLAAMAEAVRQELAPALAAAHGHLTVDVAACAILHFSPKNLRSILYNLLSNAIKYQAPGRAPQVLLRATCAAGQVLLEVHDNGLGLTEAEQGKLFVMFRRLHTHVEGSGVGLYMVKRMAENAGGSIRVRSEPGVGSVFTVVLPASA